jgi:hypothetical protein
METDMHTLAPSLSPILSLVLKIKRRVLIPSTRKSELQMMASREVQFELPTEVCIAAASLRAFSAQHSQKRLIDRVYPCSVQPLVASGSMLDCSGSDHDQDELQPS